MLLQVLILVSIETLAQANSTDFDMMFGSRTLATQGDRATGLRVYWEDCMVANVENAKV